MEHPPIHGSFVAIITPMTEDLKVDYDGFAKLLDFHLKEGTHGIVPCGTTGESATMDHATHKEIIKFIVKYVKENGPKYGRTPGEDIVVMPGTGSNSTTEAIDLTKFAEKTGADAVLLICPYYNKPTQEGLKLHFKMIADETSVPLVPYNIPSRTGRNMEAKTTIEIAKFENVVGIKEASGNLAQMMEIIQKTDDNFAVMSGDDQLTLPLIALGGKGVVSVAANIVPKMMVEFTEALLNNNFQKGKELHYKLLDLFNIQFIETNPGPIKYMASLMGLPAGNLRPPMTLPQQRNEGKIKEVMKALSLI